MKKPLFGNNIEVNCAYCDNYTEGAEGFYCRRGRQIKKGKCSKFAYNPTLRVPKGEARMMQFSKEDSEL